MSMTTLATEDVGTQVLEGKTCLITGASSGIGEAIAIDCATHGANVAINYRQSGDAANRVAQAVENIGGEAVAIRANVANPASVKEMEKRIRNEFETIDILVNNAGITADSTFEQMTQAEWDTVINTNLGGAFNCTKAFYNDIKDAQNGRIINIGSIVGEAGNIGQTNYAASKSGLSGMTRTLALELADTGATVNCVAPGFTETEMLSGVPDRVRRKIRDRIALDRFAQPHEIAAIVRFLASNESSYLTGQVIGVNGGLHR